MTEPGNHPVEGRLPFGVMICTSLIYRWRRELGQARGGFSEVVVVPPLVEATPGEVSAPAAAPAIEIEVSGGSRASILASTPPDLAAAVIAALCCA